MKHAPKFKEMFHQPGDKRKRWHVYGFYFETNLGSTTECAADEVLLKMHGEKRKPAGPIGFYATTPTFGRHQMAVDRAARTS